MDGHAIAFTTPIDAPGWKRWLLYSPVARIIVMVAFLAAVGLPLHIALHRSGLIGRHIPLAQSGWGQFLGAAVPTLVAYLALVHFIERRRPAELAWRTMPRMAAAGFAIGVILPGAVMGILWLAGSLHIHGTHDDAPLLSMFLVFGLGAGISEEIMFRGILFRMVEEGLGSWVALLVSALAFGTAHLGNPNATMWSAIAIAIEAGILLGAAYMATRSLWLCIALHAAWNIMEAPVFGTPDSGVDTHGWLATTLHGPDWLTGGSFGIEASVVTVLCSLVLSGMFLAIAIRRGRIVPPAWQRRHASAPATVAAT